MLAWESAVGQYRSRGCQRGAFHWEGQFHPPWGLIAGIRGGGEGGKKIEGQGWRIWRGDNFWRRWKCMKALVVGIWNRAVSDLYWLVGWVGKKYCGHLWVRRRIMADENNEQRIRDTLASRTAGRILVASYVVWTFSKSDGELQSLFKRANQWKHDWKNPQTAQMCPYHLSIWLRQMFVWVLGTLKICFCAGAHSAFWKFECF